ncbi:MAG: sulfatase-like hydrolase/transferase [Actinobacteria bacterium]|nr:sulfatase-like hydrolase/transferase [Actinomycetota bacterium]
MDGASDAERPATRTVLREELDYFLQVLGVSAFAIAQPVLDVIGKSPETFVFREAGTVDIYLFALVVALLPALALWLPAAGTRLFGRPIRRGVHLAMLGAMTSVITMQVGKMTTSLRDGALLAVALIAGAVMVWLITRVRALVIWLRWTAVSPVAFLLIFLMLSPVSKLLQSGEAGATAREANSVPVVMLVFDELPLASLIDPTGRINSEMFPNFEDLASGSTWYRNYTVAESFTTFSIPTILTGKSITDRSKSPLANDHPDNLFSLLSDTHRLEVFETSTALCPSEACSGSAAQGAEGGPDGGGLSGLLSDALLLWGDLSLPGESTRDTTVQFAEPTEEKPSGGHDYSPGELPLIAFLETLSPAGRPGLHYFHVMLPHVPWRTFPSGRIYQVLNWRNELPVVTDELTRPWIEEMWPVQLARQRHLLQLQYTDSLLGRVIDRLRELEMFDDALLIVTSDHGLGLHPGRERKVPTLENMHEIYWVPLFIKAPHQSRAKVDDRNLMAMDLLPTIAAMLDAEVPWRTDGRSALDPDVDRGPVKRIVRRSDNSFSLPEETLTIAQQTAQQRMRREAFVPGRDCRRARCAYLVGPGASLVGAPLSDFTIGPASALTATLTLPHTLAGDEEGPLPALVLGHLTDLGERYDGRIAVAVDGSLAGISDIWTQDGIPGWFGVLIPEFLMRQERNDPRLFEMEGSNLRPITLR